MKKLLSLLAAFLLAGMAFSPLPTTAKADPNDTLELNIISWEDYIDIGDPDSEDSVLRKKVVTLFEESYAKNHPGKKVVVNYSTKGTNEEMYNELNINKNKYDLVCPSEYMIQKMLDEDMLEPLNRSANGLAEYDANVSPYIKQLFEKTVINNKSLYDYAACYMWGTMGYVYNPEYVSKNDISHWDAVWNGKYENRATIKDSVRDSYVLALGYVYQDELNGYKTQYENGTLTATEYNAKLTELFNRVDNTSLQKTGEALKTLSSMLYGYEVDSGKKDMAAGKIWINFAWSGDAVYAMDFAEDEKEVGENTAELYYTVPVEGSNIFFDGWVMPKGADVELAQEFINFVSQPQIAQRNMDFIGYTTSIATTEIFENVVNNYGYPSYDKQEDNKYYVTIDGNDIQVYPVDLGYLFQREGDKEGKYIVYTPTLGRQFSAQYPDYETVMRCTVMRHFNSDELKGLNDMWQASKESNSSSMWIILIIVVAVAALGAVAFLLYKKGVFAPKAKKGFKVVNKE